MTFWDSVWSTAMGGVIAALVGGGVSLAIAAWSMKRAKDGARRARADEVIRLLDEMHEVAATSTDEGRARSLRLRFELALWALTGESSHQDRVRFEIWAMELGDGMIAMVQWREYEQEREKSDTYGPRVLVAVAQLNAWMSGDFDTKDLLMPFEDARRKYQLDWGDVGWVE